MISTLIFNFLWSKMRIEITKRMYTLPNIVLQLRGNSHCVLYRSYAKTEVTHLSIWPFASIAALATVESSWSIQSVSLPKGLTLSIHKYCTRIQFSTRDVIQAAKMWKFFKYTANLIRDVEVYRRLIRLSKFVCSFKNILGGHKAKPLPQS